MNLSAEHYLICCCKKVIYVILEVCKEIITDTIEQQWTKCEMFAKPCSCQYQCSLLWHSRVFDGNGIIHHHLYLHDFFNVILEKHYIMNYEWRLKRMELSTLLMNIIGYIYRYPHCLFDKDYFEFAVTNAFMEPDDYFQSIQIFSALDGGRSEIIKLLVSLNLVRSLNSNSKELIKRSIISHIHNVIFLYGFSELDSVVDTIFGSAIIAHQAFFHKYQESYKRIYLAIVAINAVPLKLIGMENAAEEHIYCLKMYFAATRDPLLTINEVRIVLYAWLKPIKQLDLFELLCEEFLKLMPECPAKFEPRNLTDLARCNIRENLKKCSLPLKASVNKLPLPESLKSFVLCDIIEISRKSANVSQEQIITMKQLDRLLI